MTMNGAIFQKVVAPLNPINKRVKCYFFLNNCLMFVRLIIIFYCLVCLFNKSALAGDCDTTISSATTSQLTCADNDSLTVDPDGSIAYDNQNAVYAQLEDGVTITNSGTIKTTTDGSKGHSAIKGQSSLNLTITNSGTIWAKEDYGIKLIQAEKVTITNQAGGTIKTTPDDAGSDFAIGGTRMGNCSTCVGSATSTGIGLTLYNYGTVESNDRTVFGGNASGHTSKKTKIYNYDGGMIDATVNSAVKFQYAEDFELYNYSGATIQADTGKLGVDLEGASTIIIDNAGTISAGTTDALVCKSCSGLTLTNSGTINAGTTVAVDVKSATGTNTITNSGTISAGGNKAIRMNLSSGVTITNSGTISTEANIAIDGENSTNATITNSGTISADTITIDLGNGNSGEDDGSGATIDNSGTIEATAANGDAIMIGDGSGAFNDVTITNSGTISALDDSVVIVAGTTGTNIVVDGNNVTFTGEIDMNETVTSMTLSCTLTKDLDIEIHNKTEMTITDNLCGNDRYEILDSSYAADPNNLAANGYLRLYAEDLEIVQDNPKFQSENILSNLTEILNTASEGKDVQLFRSIQKREEYKGSISGVVGYFTKNFFIGYTNQDVSFDNGEYMAGENMAFGLNHKYKTNLFNILFIPVVGFSDLKITNLETEYNESIDTSLTSQFMGLNAEVEKKVTINESNKLSFKLPTIFGVQRIPGYDATFLDGDLVVGENINQVLGSGFEIRNYRGTDENLELYVGGDWNTTLSGEMEITADGEEKNISPRMKDVFGHYAGLAFTINAKSFDLGLNLEYGKTGRLTTQVASLTLTKFLN